MQPHTTRQGQQGEAKQQQQHQQHCSIGVITVAVVRIWRSHCTNMSLTVNISLQVQVQATAAANPAPLTLTQRALLQTAARRKVAQQVRLGSYTGVFLVSSRLKGSARSRGFTTHSKH